MMEREKSSMEEQKTIDCENDDIKNEQKTFELNEVVHAIVSEPFNPFLNGGEHVTGIVTAIDEENEMCEVSYLHTKHKAEWISNKNIFHIQHTYDEIKIDECFEDSES